ncbi:MAG: gliding motility-associated C-terminal domain-containing protein [Bacteroidales bacterium]|nr:gliding motility-associated C-terminal domain-containing protein [Bacteroidales bacterium]
MAAFATHQRAGEITYKAISDLKYEFTIVTYTYTPSPADRPELTINWGDGFSQVVPRTQKITLPNNISRNVYAGAVHIFPGQGNYNIFVEDPNRNYGVLNIPNSVNVPFYIQTQLSINPFLGPNNSVDLLAPPIDNGCVNTLFLHNPAAFDKDGDSLSYKLVDCRGAFGFPIPGYVLPNEVNTNVPTTFDIDPITGTITWDNPIMQGEYNIAFLIEEWRSGIKIGYVTRDMQITILACDNQSPVIGTVQDTCIKAGETLIFDVSATDPDENQLVIRALGGPFVADDSPATFPPAIGTGSITSTFTWNTNCSHVQFQPYQVVFTAKDTLNFPQLADIKTVSIRVISPKPENLSATAVGNSVHLSWNRAVCQRSIGYDIYRRGGFYGFDPGACETGVPAYTGYEKINTLEGLTDTTFVDDNAGIGLVHGIDYCYMVVAFFADGSESYASDEACATLKKDIPIITNVSILETSLNAGEIYVAWSKPTEFDTLIYTGPHKYIIYRSDDQNPQFVAISENNGIDDTTFTDVVGLNTFSTRYSYKVDMYNLTSGNEVLMGSTQVARSMYLNVSPSDQTLRLSWNFEAPWRNNRYNIFRYNPVTEVFDSIGFSTQPFYNDSNLMNDTEYTYYIESFGKYSAPGLVDPIVNFSQINSGIPEDNVPPCPPVLSVKTNCELVQNDLSWVNPEGCPNDMAGFYIYYTPSLNDSLLVIDSIFDPSALYYAHTNLLSIAGCYQVAAFDSIGNTGDPSNKVCVSIDSCSSYRLPNVFTPNKDQYNEFFKPYADYTSVEKVEMKIFNRWGRIVFETNDPEINWDGKNSNNNQDCSEGVYFYVCEVFEFRLEGLSKRTITGSITLLR